MTVTIGSTEETRRAWDRYAAALQGKSGAEYEEAEARAWERLQDDLGDQAHDDSTVRRDPVE
jgi:hypothetical protein